MVGESPDAALLRKIVRGRVEENKTLAPYTSFNIGGPADVVFTPVNSDDVAACVDFVTASGVDMYVLGAGSNVLISDDGFRGIVMLTSGLTGIAHDGVRWSAGSGDMLQRLAVMSVDEGYRGLEFGSGIPGSVGGAVVVNAGAHGQDVFSVLNWVEVCDGMARVKRFGKGELRAGYRWSCLEEKRLIVTRVGFELDQGDQVMLKRKVKDQLQRRKKHHPLDTYNAGSFFKNPDVVPAGELIEKAGLKGKRVGGASVSQLHGNFIVNDGTATCEQVMQLCEQIREVVHAEFGVWLEMEVRLVGAGVPAGNSGGGNDGPVCYSGGQ